MAGSSMAMTASAAAVLPGLVSARPSTLTVPRRMASRARERDAKQALRHEKFVEAEADGRGGGHGA